MYIFPSILLIFLILVTTGSHVYFVWKKRDRRSMWVQLGLMLMAVLVGIIVVNNVDIPSLAQLLNRLSPIGSGNGGI